MKLVHKVDFMNHKRVVFMMNVLSILLIFPFFQFFTWIVSLVSSRKESVFGLTDLLLILLSLFILLIIHELLHAFFFKILGDGTSKVKFGFKKGMAYVTSPGSFYSRFRMLVIGLAPFVIISIFLTLFLVFGWLQEAIYVPVASLHAVGCVGDFYLVYQICRQKGKILVEDTEVGINIYKEERNGK